MLSPLNRHLQAVALMLAACLAGCGGGSGSSPLPEPGPGPAIQNVMVYQGQVAEGDRTGLYVLNREGEARRLSEDAGTATVKDHVVSPDGKQVAYWYQQLALVMLALDDPEARPTRLAVGGGVPAVADHDWLQWLPDSRRMLYSTSDTGGGLPNALWLASVGRENPVQLVAPQQGVSTSLKYAVSADGSRAAVTVNYLGVRGCCSSVVSAALYLLDLETVADPVLVDSASGDSNGFLATWSPAGHELLIQRRLQEQGLDSASGPLTLVQEDGREFPLWQGDNEPDTRWLDPGRVLVALPGGFELIDTDGGVLASHSATINRDDTGAGSTSVTLSPDGRRLAFLDWSSESDLEVYLLDLDDGVTRAIGPASSEPIIWHFTAGTKAYVASELRWSGDGSWLAWDRKSVTAEQDSVGKDVYTYNIATAETRLVAVSTISWGWEDYPLLPEGNVLEYWPRVAETVTPFYVLVVDNLDSGQTVFAEPYPMPSFEVKDPDLDETWRVVQPQNVCWKPWLDSGEILWNGCDANIYRSRIAEGTLGETRLIARGRSSLLASRNREMFLFAPYNADDGWQMYDYSRDRLFKLGDTTSISSYTWLL